MHVKVKFTEGFKDGNIFGGKEFVPGEVAVLTENEVARARSSGALFEEVERVIPNPLKAERFEQTKEPNDELNAENEINDLATHIPGTDEEVAEVRERDAEAKKAKKDSKKK